MIKAGQTVLFQGDSITDAGRLRERTESNDIKALGSGYGGMIAAGLLAARPRDGLNFFNRGTSGNRVTDLLARWRWDAVQLRPDWISVLIGVNDTIYEFDCDRGTSLPVYEKVYRLLLEMTATELPNTRFVLCAPFAVARGGFKREWCGDIGRRAAIVQKLAAEFDAVYVPFQDLFGRLETGVEPGYWLPDGVHPSPGGHAKMASFWREKVGVPCAD